MDFIGVFSVSPKEFPYFCNYVNFRNFVLSSTQHIKSTGHVASTNADKRVRLKDCQ